MDYTIKLQTGLAQGPFDIFYISSSNMVTLATGVSRQSLLNGYTLTGIPTNATVLEMHNTDPDCLTTASYFFPTPTPTPTPSPTPTPTPSPTSTPTPTPTPSPTATPTITPTITPSVTPSITPTITPTVTPTVVYYAYFDSGYSGGNSACTGQGTAYSRLTAVPGSTVTLSFTISQFVNGIASPYTKVCISGEVYNTTLPYVSPVPGGTTYLTDSQNTTTVPSSISHTTSTTVTIPGSGYIDMLVYYRTQNLASNFSAGSGLLKITAINGTPVSNGDQIVATYACSNAGAC